MKLSTMSLTEHSQNSQSSVMNEQTFRRKVEELAEKLRTHPNKDEILELMEQQLLDDNQ